MNRRIIYIIFLTVLNLQVFSQDITGSWNALLKVPGQSLRLVLQVNEKDSSYTATLISLDQSKTGVPVTKFSFENNKLIFNIQNTIHYEGSLSNDSIIGLFKQYGATIPLVFKKSEVNIYYPKRIQEPKKPYPYYEEDVCFNNPSDPDIHLSGTLTMPNQKGNFPAVILISGSGAQNRNSEAFGHKPFLIIADFLTRNGFAVLRYDDRGTASSTGSHDTCSTYDFSIDAEAAFQYLQRRGEINSKQIGFIGHSEGGMIASLVSARNNDVAFIVLLAAPGIRGDSLMLLQTKLLTSGMDDKEREKALDERRKQDSIILNSIDSKEMVQNLTTFFEEVFDKQTSVSSTQKDKEDFVKVGVKLTTSKFYQYLIKYDPVPIFSQVRCPVLALNGENDMQVPADENLNSIQKILMDAGNKSITIKKLPKLNHLFQTSQTGSISEYSEIEETISLEVLEIISDWLRKKHVFK